MGADIHAFVEAKVDGNWYLFDQPDVDRSYALFDKMAGVRGDGEDMIAAPKGLPDDLSTMTRLMADRWEGDGHTHSWFNQEELAKLEEWYEDRFDFYREFGWSIKFYADEDAPITDKRLVFWFDN